MPCWLGSSLRSSPPTPVWKVLEKRHLPLIPRWVEREQSSPPSWPKVMKPLGLHSCSFRTPGLIKMSFPPVPCGAKTKCHSFYILSLQVLQDIKPKSVFGDSICLWPRAGLLQAPRLSAEGASWDPRLRGAALSYQSTLHWKALGSATPGWSWGRAWEDCLWIQCPGTPKEATGRNGKKQSYHPPPPHRSNHQDPLFGHLALASQNLSFPKSKKSKLVTELSPGSVFSTTISSWLWTAKNDPDIKMIVLIWAAHQMLVQLWVLSVISVTSYLLNSIQERYIQASRPHKCGIRNGVRYSRL